MALVYVVILKVLSEVKRNFDALERDEWRISVQPVLAQVVRDCRFKTGAVPMTLQLSESIENSQAKRTLFKKKAEVGRSFFIVGQCLSDVLTNSCSGKMQWQRLGYPR